MKIKKSNLENKIDTQVKNLEEALKKVPDEQKYYGDKAYLMRKHAKQTKNILKIREAKQS